MKQASEWIFSTHLSPIWEVNLINIQIMFSQWHNITVFLGHLWHMSKL